MNEHAHSVSPGFRGDIEGLRAIAVLAVLAYHARLGPFSGGYVGVDVFFVVSGYLITSLLTRDLVHSSWRALPAFWARRARRLLPASFVMVVSTLVVGRVVLDPLASRDLMRDGLAVSTFTVNVVFAHRQNDYLAAQLAPSPLLHCWSLALEEQFYVVWPGLLLVAVSVRRRLRWFPAAMVGVLLAGSLALCIAWTPHHQPASFFLLPARAWELLTGAALATIGASIDRVHRVVRAVGGWVGLAAIVITTLRFDDLTRFPGAAAALPVTATALVLAAGGASHGPARLLDIRPLTWLGARSYGIYLWHWPVLVLAGTAFGPLNAVQRLAGVVAAVMLAAVSFRLVEDPARRSQWLGARARRSLLLGGGLGLTAAGVAAVMLVLAPTLDGGSIAAAPALVLPVSKVSAASSEPPATEPAAGTTTTEARATTPTAVTSTSATTVSPSPEAVMASLSAANAPTLAGSATNDDVPSNLTPSLRSARADKPQIYADGCILDNGRIDKVGCVYGDTASPTTVVLFGDSHAAQWFPALQDIAVRNHWRLEVRTKKGCPTAEIPIADRARGPECGPWRATVIAHLADEHPALVIMSAYRYKTTGRAVGSTPDEVWRNGLQITLDAVRPLATNVMLLGDTPTPLDDVPGCVAAHRHRVSACMNARASAVKPTRLAVERDVATAHDASFVPTADWLCTDTECPVVIGNLLVYRDNSHITTAAARWLEPYLAAAVEPLLTG